MTEHLDVLMVAFTLCVLMAGFQVGFTLAGAALFFAFIGDLTGAYNLAQLNFIAQRIYGIMSNDVLMAVPLFVFMGLMLERSRVAEDLLLSMGHLFGNRRGGLVFSVVLVGALLAASTGIVGATVVTMGLISLPVMLRQGYDPKLATGTICAAGTLGQIIPPSIVLVLLGDFLSTANQRANMISGNITGKSVSVSDLFAGALAPGLILVVLYIGYLAFIAWWRPESLPVSNEHDANADGRSLSEVLLTTLGPPLALILAVLGAILAGIATPTEAAAVGAVGAILLGAGRFNPRHRKFYALVVASGILLIFLASTFDLRAMRTEIPVSDRVAIILAAVASTIIIFGIMIATWSNFRANTLTEVVIRTARITAMVFVILVGASLFTLVFRGLGGEETIQEFLSKLPGGLFGAMAFFLLAVFVLGFFLDFLEIIFIVVPILAPPLILMGADPIWLGVLLALNLQTSFLTPPFGFALFFLRSVTPDSVATTQIYRGVIPFIALQVAALLAVAAIPELATWLPEQLFD